MTQRDRQTMGPAIRLEEAIMPFPQQQPRVFNKQNVLALKENQYGVYGIFRQGHWIYVGKGDIRERLLAHLDGDNPCILNAQPTHWVDEVTSNADAREKQLIRELNPSCNVQLT